MFISFVVSKVVIHGHVTLFGGPRKLWALCHTVEEATHLMQDGKQDTGRTWGPNVPVQDNE